MIKNHQREQRKQNGEIEVDDHLKLSGIDLSVDDSNNTDLD